MYVYNVNVVIFFSNELCCTEIIEDAASETHQVVYIWSCYYFAISYLHISTKDSVGIKSIGSKRRILPFYRDLLSLR